MGTIAMVAMLAGCCGNRTVDLDQGEGPNRVNALLAEYERSTEVLASYSAARERKPFYWDAVPVNSDVPY